MTPRHRPTVPSPETRGVTVTDGWSRDRSRWTRWPRGRGTALNAGDRCESPRDGRCGDAAVATPCGGVALVDRARLEPDCIDLIAEATLLKRPAYRHCGGIVSDQYGRLVAPIGGAAVRVCPPERRDVVMRARSVAPAWPTNTTATPAARLPASRWELSARSLARACPSRDAPHSDG
jgi:hypothetical protein